MKILITTDWYSSGTNGVIISIKNLSEALTALGHDVRILTVSSDTHSHTDGRVYLVGSLPVGVYPDARVPVKPVRRFVDELVQWRPDVIHSQCELCSMPYALRISSLTGAPIVHTYHTLYEQYLGYIAMDGAFGSHMLRQAVCRRLKNVSMIIAPTEKIKNVLEGYGISRPIRVIPSGIDLSRMAGEVSESERVKKRAELGISADAPVLICLGRLGVEKNIGELIEYFVKVKREFNDAVFMIVGDGPDRARLEGLTSELGLKDSVVFTGMVPSDKVHEYYKLGDIFVCASTSEAQGLTYIEAAACGLPLVCRYDRALDGVIEQGSNGFAYNNEAEFVEAVRVMISSPELRSKAGSASLKTAARYDRSAFGLAAQSAYRELIGERL